MDLISIEPKEGLAFRAEVRGHQLTIDMPPDEDGADEGPRPTEIMVTALGTCIAISIARYCETISCSSEGLGLYLTYQLADKPKRIASIVVDVEMPDDFPKTRLSAVRRLIEACPVHNTFLTTPEIDIEISA